MLVLTTCGSTLPIQKFQFQTLLPTVVLYLPICPFTSGLPYAGYSFNTDRFGLQSSKIFSDIRAHLPLCYHDNLQPGTLQLGTCLGQLQEDIPISAYHVQLNVQGTGLYTVSQQLKKSDVQRLSNQR